MVLIAKAKPPSAITHKKRVGAHHRRNRDYTKPYLPYLPLLVVVGLGLFLNMLWSHQGSSVLGYATDVSTSNLLADTNADRQSNGENGLQLSSQLMTAAQNKANDMVARNYWSHDTPTGQMPWSFISATGYQYQAAGENLAYGFNSSSALLNGWMHSPEHRANVLDKSYSQVGFGIANSPNYQGNGPETIVVAMYAEPIATTAGAAQSSRTTPAIATLPASNGAQPNQQGVARIQTLPFGAAWTLFAVTALGAVAMFWFATRHVLAWKRVLAHSEEFVIRHRFLDVFIISAATLGYILTRTAGFIR